MDRPTDRIEQHLDSERQALRSNLEELENRVRSAVDWRGQFRGHTATFLGLACAGGVLIGLMTARRMQAPPVAEYPLTPGDKPGTAYNGHRRQQLSLAWRGIESALIGLAAAKLKDTLADLLPGFREQVARRERDE